MLRKRIIQFLGFYVLLEGRRVFINDIITVLFSYRNIFIIFSFHKGMCNDSCELFDCLLKE